jgi:hypothetical protein
MQSDLLASVLALVSARSAEQRLTTADFAAEELEAPIKEVRSALRFAVRSGSLRNTIVGSQVCYSV